MIRFASMPSRPGKPAGLAFLIAMLALSMTSASAQEMAQTDTAANGTPPNIVLIILDDVGLTDLGVTGGEARTPAIDALAARGALFASFNTAPMCAPSRAMLMTGVDSHDAGIANLPETTPADLRGDYGYEGRLTRRAATLAEHLGAAGYQTFIAGKWHLGHDADSLPAARGFDRSLVLDASGADNWEDRPYLAVYDRAEWWQDDAPARRPDEGVFSSTMLVDTVLTEIARRDRSRPFFATLAFQAVHIPVQAPPEIVAAYDGVYDQGWDALAARRHAGAVARGLIPESAAPPVFPDGLRDWDTLDPQTRAFVTASMEVNAAMLDATDREIARLVAALRADGSYDNTIFVVVSDNGPEHNRPDLHRGTSFWLRRVGYSTNPDDLGGPGSYAWIGPEWAKAAAGQGAFFKMHAGSGGMNVPLILAGPGIPARGVVRDFAYATDLLPTLLALTGTPALPAEIAPAGRALDRLWAAPAMAEPSGPEQAVGMEAGGQSALFLGRYKLVRNAAPYGDGQWRLFNWTADPGETVDLSASLPDVLARMMAEWDAYVAAKQVQPVDPDYTPGRLLARHAYARTAQQAGLGLAGLIALILAVVFILRLPASPT